MGTTGSLDVELENRKGLYVVHEHYDEDNTLVAGSWGTASFSDFPDLFPNEGEFERPDGKPLITLEGHGQVLFGEVAGTAMTPIGRVGLEFGADGNLVKGSFVSGQGGKVTSIFTGDDEVNVGGGVSFIAGIEHREKFDTQKGTFTGESNTTASLIVGSKKLGNIKGGGGASAGGSKEDSSIRIGVPELKIALGFGVSGGLFISINKQPRLSGEEESLQNALESNDQGAKQNPIIQN